MNYVRWGILGTGNIANRFAKAITNADGAKLVAVASRNIHTADNFADKYNIENRFSSYEALASFEGVDAVYIALPHIYHAQYAKIMMQAGKHVLSEKPICINSNQIDELIQIQKEQNVFLMEALWTRFLPAYAQIKAIISNGLIGDVLEVSADFCYNLENKAHNVYNANFVGGSLLDVGIYGLNFASMILGDDVTEINSTVFQNNGVDERTHIMLKYKNGAIARISSALCLAKPEDAYIYGSSGYIRIPTFYAATTFDVVKKDSIQTYNFPFKGNGFEEEIEECNRCILNNKSQSDIMPLSNSSSILKIMDSVRNQHNIMFDVDK